MPRVPSCFLYSPQISGAHVYFPCDVFFQARLLLPGPVCFPAVPLSLALLSLLGKTVAISLQEAHTLEGEGPAQSPEMSHRGRIVHSVASVGLIPISFQQPHTACYWGVWEIKNPDTPTFHGIPGLCLSPQNLIPPAFHLTRTPSASKAS